MGFLDFFKDIGQKVSDVWKPKIGKVADAGRWIGSKVSPIVDGVRSAVNFASNLPVIGTAIQALKNTPIGQGISQIGSGIAGISDALKPPPQMDYNVN